MKCSYCGETATKTLGIDHVCYDCFCHLAPTAADRETRTATLISHLQKQHASVLELPPSSPIKSWWLERLSRRLSVLRGVGVEAEPPLDYPIAPEPFRRKGPMKIHRAR